MGVDTHNGSAPDTSSALATRWANSHVGLVVRRNGVSKRASDLTKAQPLNYLDVAYQRSDLLEERRVPLQRWVDYEVHFEGQYVARRRLRYHSEETGS